MAHTARFAFSSYLGPQKISSELDDPDLAKGGGVARPYYALASSRSSSSEEIFSGPKCDEKATPIRAVLIREDILGRVTI